LLLPNLTTVQVDDVYEKVIKFYLNGNEALSEQDVYQAIQVSHK
jgi:hypothetical protein